MSAAPSPPAPGRSTARRLLAIARAPIAAGTRAALAAAWARLPLHLRTANQFLGRQYAGCAATIGAMPRCDFACTGSHLGEGATRVPPLRLAAVYAELDRLRAWLGSGGNLQLSDGEIPLRPAGRRAAFYERTASEPRARQGAA